jgi:DNA polymerase iota
VVEGEERNGRANGGEEEKDRLVEAEDRVFQDEDDDSPIRPQLLPCLSVEMAGSEDIPTPSQQKQEDSAMCKWESEDEDMGDSDVYLCEKCGALMPLFAQFAHERFHGYS